MVQNVFSRGPRKPARYLAHTNVLGGWFVYCAQRAAQRRAQQRLTAFGAVCLVIAIAACLFVFTEATTKTQQQQRELSLVRSQMKQLGAGAEEATVQREYRTILTQSLEANAQLLDPLAKTLNEMPISCWPEQVTSNYQDDEPQVSGRVLASNGESKFEFVRVLETRGTGLEAKIESFGLETKEGKPVERFSFIVKQSTEVTP